VIFMRIGPTGFRTVWNCARGRIGAYRRSSGKITDIIWKPDLSMAGRVSSLLQLTCSCCVYAIHGNMCGRNSYTRAEVNYEAESIVRQIKKNLDAPAGFTSGDSLRFQASTGILLSLLLFLVVTLLPMNTSAQSSEGELFGMMRSFLIEDGWTPTPVPGTNVIETGFQGENGAVFCRAHMLEEKRQIVFYSILPNKAPVDRRVQVMEFVTRANFGLGIGNFEFDLDDGEVRFKTSVDVEGGQITPTMIETLVYLNVLTTDRYLPGVNAVMFGGVDPLPALQGVQDELEAGSSGG
jgi:Putative bacterial sensory transduction regulator